MDRLSCEEHCHRNNILGILDPFALECRVCLSDWEDAGSQVGVDRARDEFVGAREALPGSTLVIVSGFTREEFKVEVEVTAAAQ